MTEGGDDVDIDASEWIYRYPSSETVFWNDIDMLIINDKNKNKINHINWIIEITPFSYSPNNMSSTRLNFFTPEN